MATNDQESRVSLKLLIDDKKKRVIAAEANKDFVDILFSFLTFPIGTIIRLTNNNKKPMPKISTCINNLYKSVENLSVNHLYTEHCKSILLSPRNPCIEDCLKLKVKIDDSVSNKYFKCSNENCSKKCWLVNVNCCCGGKTTKEIFSDITNPTNDYSGVFMRGGIDFIISDELRVLPGSPSALVQLFSDLGYNDMNQIKEMYVEVGKEEILRLLTYSLISKSPLTEVFMNKQAIVDNNIMTDQPRISQVFRDMQTGSSKLNLKLILSKSRNKILYAEAKDSFVDFLFSFLTFPLGSVNHVLKDDLEVKPMCSTSSFGLLKELNVPLFDIEEQMISIGEAEARCLLQAALIGSSSALTLALSSFLTTQKEEKD